MQHRYFGDVGDFGKYGLLEALCIGDDENPKLTLGINWYLTYPESQEMEQNDGKYRSYLNNPEKFRECAPRLFDQLKQINQHPPLCNVSSSSTLGILPNDTLYYDSLLSFSTIQSKSQRLEHRRRWFNRSMKALNGADVIFLDPDNGLETKSTHPLDGREPKYVSCEELSLLLGFNDISVVLYQHAWRDKQFISNTLKRINEICKGRRLFALLYHRGTRRSFIVIPCKQHAVILQKRAERFLRSKWQNHFYPALFLLNH